MKLSLRAKLTSVILTLAVLITATITIGSYLQMRSQMINTSIRNEVVGTATGTAALIKEWISSRKAIVTLLHRKASAKRSVAKRHLGNAVELARG